MVNKKNSFAKVEVSDIALASFNRGKTMSEKTYDPKNLRVLQDLWRQDEVIYTTLFTEKNIKPLRRVLPYSQSEKSQKQMLDNINESRKDLAEDLNLPYIPKDLNDIKLCTKENGEPHLYIESVFKSKTMSIRYAKTAYINYENKHFFYVYQDDLQYWRNLDYIIFIDKQFNIRFMVDAKAFCDDIIYNKPINNGYDIDYMKSHDYIKYLWNWKNDKAFITAFENKTEKDFIIIDNLDQRYFRNFDRCEICGRRDTSHAFKVYKDGNIYTFKKQKDFVEQFAKSFNEDIETVTNRLRSAIKSSNKKYNDYKSTGKIPRSKTCFKNSDGMFIFDNCWEDEDIKNYMKKMTEKEIKEKLQKEIKSIEEDIKLKEDYVYHSDLANFEDLYYLCKLKTNYEVKKQALLVG